MWVNRGKIVSITSWVHPSTPIKNGDHAPTGDPVRENELSAAAANNKDRAAIMPDV